MASHRFGFLARLCVSVLRCLLGLLPDVGVKIMEESWDRLIVLDACRYDVLKPFNRIPGGLYKRESLGSNTGE